MVPLLVFLAVGGATADRFARRTVLAWSNLGSGLTQGAVAALLLSGHYSLGLVAVLEFADGVLAAFTSPALRGFVPELVAPGEIQRANALLASLRNAAKVFGPSLSGVLVVAVGGGPAIAFDAATYLVAAVCLGRLSTASRPPGTGPGGRSAGFLGDIREGWDQFRALRWVWTVSAAFCVVNMVQTGTWQILGPELIRRDGGAAAWGLILSARGVGLLAMSALMARLRIRYLLRFGQLMCVLNALPLLAVGSGLGAPWAVAASLAGGVGSAAAAISWDTSLQEHVPSATLSRVASLDDLLSYAAIPVGQLAVGPLAGAFGAHRVMVAAGIVFAVATFAPVGAGPVRRLPHAV